MSPNQSSCKGPIVSYDFIMFFPGIYDMQEVRHLTSRCPSVTFYLPLSGSSYTVTKGDSTLTRCLRKKSPHPDTSVIHPSRSESHGRKESKFSQVNFLFRVYNTGYDTSQKTTEVKQVVVLGVTTSLDIYIITGTLFQLVLTREYVVTSLDMYISSCQK